jgi:hypothetical protein
LKLSMRLAFTIPEPESFLIEGCPFPPSYKNC